METNLFKIALCEAASLLLKQGVIFLFQGLSTDRLGSIGKNLALHILNTDLGVVVLSLFFNLTGIGHRQATTFGVGLTSL